MAGFEQFCLQRGASGTGGGGSGGAAQATVALAREYIELQRLGRAPGPAQLQEWKEALIRTVQELLGHEDVTTTQIYTHVMRKPGLGVRSPRDGMERVG